MAIEVGDKYQSTDGQWHSTAAEAQKADFDSVYNKGNSGSSGSSSSSSSSSSSGSSGSSYKPVELSAADKKVMNDNIKNYHRALDFARELNDKANSLISSGASKKSIAEVYAQLLELITDPNWERYSKNLLEGNTHEVFGNTVRYFTDNISSFKERAYNNFLDSAVDVFKEGDYFAAIQDLCISINYGIVCGTSTNRPFNMEKCCNFLSQFYKAQGDAYKKGGDDNADVCYCYAVNLADAEYLKKYRSEGITFETYPDFLVFHAETEYKQKHYGVALFLYEKAAKMGVKDAKSKAEEISKMSISGGSYSSMIPTDSLNYLTLGKGASYPRLSAPSISLGSLALKSISGGLASPSSSSSSRSGGVSSSSSTSYASSSSSGTATSKGGSGSKKVIAGLVIAAVIIGGGYFAVNKFAPNLLSSVKGKTVGTNAAAERTVSVTADSLNLRSQASGNADIVNTLKKGDTLTVTGDAVNGWLPVRFQNSNGYVSEQYVSAAQGAANTQSNTFAVSPSAWQQGDDANFARNTKIQTGTETVSGEQKEVLTVEVNPPSGIGWVGGQAVIERTNTPVITRIKQAAGVRFKVSGDGKSWKLMFPTTETVADWCSYEYEIRTTRNRVTEVNIPYSSLRQPSWGRQVSFNKNNIVAVVLQRGTDSDFGTATIKVFDFEIY